MARLIPCVEKAPSLPKKPKSRRKPPRAYAPEELFGFDTETTVDGVKELRSYQAAWINKETGKVDGCVFYLSGYYQDGVISSRLPVIEAALADYGVKMGAIQWVSFDDIDNLRAACQAKHEMLLYDGGGKKNRKKTKRCAVAYNGNFDMGVLADSTTLDPELKVGGMEGAGVTYHFSYGS